MVTPSDDRDALACPNCGERGLHAMEAGRSRRDDNSYQSGIVVKLVCETCPFLTTISIQSHKGLAYVGVYTRKNAAIEQRQSGVT
jgi:predicted RNA-binding Zn-ribbon protein involved in translation (DUF1610 family)